MSSSDSEKRHSRSNSPKRYNIYRRCIFWSGYFREVIISAEFKMAFESFAAHYPYSQSFSDRSDSRSVSPQRRRSRSRSADHAAEQLGRLHICNFDESLKKDDLKDAFGLA